MNVLHILNELQPSGAETMLKVASSTFIEKGIQSSILSTGKNVGDFAQELEKSGYSIFHIPFNKNLSFFVQLYKFINKHNFDAIHLHTERANFWIGIIALLSTRKPVIRTVHAVFSFEGKLKVIRGLQRRLLNKFGLKHITIGQSVYDNELSRFRNKSLLIPNWYDNNKFTPVDTEQKKQLRNKLGLPEDTVIIISVGNASKVKNYRSIIAALPEIELEKILYIAVGLEDRNNTERQLTIKQSVEDKVKLVGPKNNVHEYLSASDVYIMPSLQEGFGIAAIEALSCGLPCLFSDVSGLRDFKNLEPKLTNLFYCETSSKSITSSLNILLKENLLTITDEASNNHTICSIAFGVENGTNQYISLYKSGKN